MSDKFLPLFLIGFIGYAAFYLFIRKKQEYGFLAKLVGAAVAGVLWYCVASAVIQDPNVVSIVLGVLLTAVLAFADGVLCPMVQGIGRIFLDYFRTGR